MDITWIRRERRAFTNHLLTRFDNGYGLSVIPEEFASVPGLSEAAVIRWTGDGERDWTLTSPFEEPDDGILRYATVSDVEAFAQRVADLPPTG